MRHSGLPMAGHARLLVILALGVGATSCGDGSSTAHRTAAREGPTETSPAPGLKFHRDTRAETDASSDIRNVVVASDRAGLLSFQLAVSPSTRTPAVAYRSIGSIAQWGYSD